MYDSVIVRLLALECAHIGEIEHAVADATLEAGEVKPLGGRAEDDGCV